MKSRQMMVIGLTLIFAMMLAGEAMARGGNGGGSGNGNGIKTQSWTTNRPAGSQRRDGTFLTTGTTANGATIRPDNSQRVVPNGCRLYTTRPTNIPAPVMTE